MAATTLPAIMQDGDLTDEQIEQMLARATGRLKEKSQSTEQSKKNEIQRYNFPKLQTGTLDKPYVSSNGEVATLDSKRLLEERQRKGANGIRRVEEPVASKKAAQAVRFAFTISMSSLAYDEKFSKFFLERSSGTVLVCLSA